MFTYLVCDLKKKKQQIGSTKSLETGRPYVHFTDDCPNPILRNATRKRQQDFFVFISEDDGLNTRDEEQYYLDFYHGTPWCYNISPNANGGHICTEFSVKGGKASWKSLTESGQTERIDRLRDATRDLHSETDEQGRSLHAVNTLGPFFTDPEHQRNAALAAHSDRDELGRSLLAVKTLLKVHDEKDEWGRSKHAVERSGALNKSKQWLFTDSETGEEFGPFPSASVASDMMGIPSGTIKKKSNTGKPTRGYIITSY